MTEPCKMGWWAAHCATDNLTMRHVVARSEVVCGTHGYLWPCMTTGDNTKETP